ncbi:NitT/TauT family transport system substrate-binding protein [Herbaspirillum sp. Sphag1AN]|uniref:ABC transporter substrate-binding protein n=1 Tax=unclassified Herbaspirillum TaxID=2624150 RepID=UPI001617F2E2|nr:MULTISPECIES: ABC transporter substrate-binding protein [unclassified Herbaspirillum]MBB3213031.1 NitT/TauT family transport system substrate-binding protein [Herbaspirillum sp. Sphag1AN]MBB3246228.1 NitT/TauT family transport system substrate-binding protein [Herbaspirillum sp. Sphag64]
MSKRMTLIRLGAALFGALSIQTAMTAHAQDKVTLLSNWYAQAEHGGFYQAVAKGIYKKYGLDVTIKMGGPQVNNMQILLAGQADFSMGYDFTVLKGVEQGLPLVTVGTSFQSDLQGMMTHADVSGLGALKNKTILVAGSGQSSWWPWLKAKYGYTDAQSKPYTFNLQPFFADPNIVQQAYPSSELYQAEKSGSKAKFFLFAQDGYPPYGTTIITLQKTIASKPDLVKRFVKATAEGWKSYLEDPAPANALIRQDNKDMTDDQLAYALKKLKELKVVTGGDAATQGIGIMTDERWKKTYETMVATGLLKADVDYHKAYTTQFVKDMHVMP